MASYTEDMSILSGKSFTTSDINLGKPKVNVWWKKCLSL